MTYTDSGGWSPVRSLRSHWTLALGVGGMLLLVWGTFVEPGSPGQQRLFLAGGVTMGATAYANDERMLTVLQAVISLGAGLAFIDGFSTPAKLVVLCGTAALGVGWLIRIDYLAEDRWWPIGGSGLFFLAVAFAISGTDPLALNGLLTVGTALVLCYSLLSFFLAEVRLQALWVLLNTVFILNPAKQTLGLLGLI